MYNRIMNKIHFLSQVTINHWMQVEKRLAIKRSRTLMNLNCSQMNSIKIVMKINVTLLLQSNRLWQVHKHRQWKTRQFLKMKRSQLLCQPLKVDFFFDFVFTSSADFRNLDNLPLERRNLTFSTDIYTRFMIYFRLINRFSFCR